MLSRQRPDVLAWLTHWQVRMPMSGQQPEYEDFAPGWPGIPPRWTSSAKVGVGTALGNGSPIWFTLSHGILNEVYYPRIDQACIRDLGLLVIGPDGFFSEIKRDTLHEVAYLEPGVPAYRLTNTCTRGRFRITSEFVSDPERDVVLQRSRFEPLAGVLTDYRVFVLLAPHLNNQGTGNTAWIDDYKGVPMLFAERPGIALALASNTPWLLRSAGFAGSSDGWSELKHTGSLARAFRRAENGNVALLGEIDIQSGAGSWTLALGFSRTPVMSAFRARESLIWTYSYARDTYVAAWQAWQKAVEPIATGNGAVDAVIAASAAVLRTHEEKGAPGGIVASLSIPWGTSKGDDDLGGYHLVWPRDLVEAAGGLLALGLRDDARRVIAYLHTTQNADGSWPQNMWLDGSPYWGGIQMDEAAFPILLVELALRQGAGNLAEEAHLWPMVRSAAGFIVRNGPVTQEDRWEEDAGYSPFTLAVEIAALRAACSIAERLGEPAIACYLGETADAWDASIERWTYVEHTELARQVGVDGYYVRIAPVDVAESGSPGQGWVEIKNRPPESSRMQASAILSPDALALVRFGLRAADDPRILNTVKAIDATLRTQTATGPVWHRYTGDGYGEHADGAGFDGTGIGRGWPLFAGERGHYELAAGRPDQAHSLLQVMAQQAGDGGMLPEQVWDADDLPALGLQNGRPAGSAMPLVWAHAEFVKLARSLRDGVVFDRPSAQAPGSPPSRLSLWRFNNKLRSVPAGNALRIDVLDNATVHWSVDGWHTTTDTPATPSGLGTWYVDLPSLTAGTAVVFTLYWPDQARWEGTNYTVGVEAAPPVTP